jgi:chorismate-pyruvate lyase
MLGRTASIKPPQVAQGSSSSMHAPIQAMSEETAFTREDILASATLSRFQKILLLSDGSVTELLCIYTGHAIRTVKIAQWIGAGHTHGALHVAPDTQLLHRKIILSSRDSAQVYAESVFIHARLSASTEKLLHGSDTPIGKLWKQERTEMYRDIVDIRSERNAEVADRFALPGDAPLLSRTYLLWQDGSPMGAITEKFPLASFSD